MNWTLVTGPTGEPVTVDDAKAHLRVDISDDDPLISALITAAREMLEEMTRRALITQTWRLSLDDWPAGGEIELPRSPLQSVTSVLYTDEDGNAAIWDTANYIVDTDAEPGRIVLTCDGSYPNATLQVANGVQITYVAGYGDVAGDVPERLKQAIKLIIGHWYENREASINSGAMPKEIPFAVQSLIWLSKVY